MKRPPDCSKEEIETIGSKTIIVSNFVEKIFFSHKYYLLSPIISSKQTPQRSAAAMASLRAVLTRPSLSGATSFLAISQRNMTRRMYPVETAMHGTSAILSEHQYNENLTSFLQTRQSSITHSVKLLRCCNAIHRPSQCKT